MNKQQEVVQKFRSGQPEAETGREEGTTRSKSFPGESAGTMDYPASSPRHHHSDALWVTSASHPSPYFQPPADGQGQSHTGSRPRAYTTGFLSDLSLQNTPLTSGGVNKMSLPGVTNLTAQELHDSVLSALGDTPTSPVKSPGERRLSKKQPKGTFKYTVQEGDTLVKIGAHFDVTPSELMKTNKMLSRTVFVGQILFIPDPNYVRSETSTPPRSASPVADTRPKMDIPLATLPSVPGHAVQISPPTTPGKVAAERTTSSLLSHQKSQTEEESDKECLQKFLKMPVRRVVKEELEENHAAEGFIVKGTLLVTPNAIMFDPDVNDPIVIEKDGMQRYSVVVYMEEVKGVALFHDIPSRMFRRQSKEVLGTSPKPEMYRAGQGKRPKIEGQAEGEGQECPLKPDTSRVTPDGASIKEKRVSPVGREAAGESKVDTGRTSEELEHMAEMCRQMSDASIQPGRASEEVEHALTRSRGYSSGSPVVKQMSHSSELEVCEMSQFPDEGEVFGATRDFGPHMGRSSSEVHRHTSSSLGRIYDASPGDMCGHSIIVERSDSTNESISTPTQGFAPVHFTDRSPKSVTTHPKPVPGKRAVLTQSPVASTNLKSEENKIVEVTEGGITDVNAVRQLDVPAEADDNICQPNPSSTLDMLQTAGTRRLSAENMAAESLITTKLDASTSGPDLTSPPGHSVAYQKKNLATALEEETQTNPSQVSTQSSFSLLRTSTQHTSSFNYTSSFYRNTSTGDSSSSISPPVSETKGQYIFLPSSGLDKFQLKSEFTKEDIARALGPDPKEFLHRSDSPHFEESPLYLQIRPGIQKDSKIHQPRAFDHRNVRPLLHEYWFVVSNDMGDKLYNFLMEWQPDAYGDEEETKPREKFFYDVSLVESNGGLAAERVLNTKAAGDGLLAVPDDHLHEVEKSWEILSKEEVYRAERELEMIDESNFPELIGPTVIVSKEHIRSIMRSLPRCMSVGYNWELVYATHKHGYSLQNLYMRTEHMESDAPVLLFIMDTYGNVFGAYLSSTIRPNDTFYGSGATFLFTFYPTFQKFPWRGANQFFMHGTRDFFAVGSGEGVFGLWLDGGLDKGRSHECATFENDVLTKEEDFSILQLEVWKFVDSSQL